MYKLNYFDGKVCSIQKDNISFPLCEANTDYQDFLKWNSEQEKPLDLNSTIPVVVPEKPRDYLAEIDALKIQVAANTTKITSLEKTK